jgi:hypothetical protein
LERVDAATRKLIEDEPGFELRAPVAVGLVQIVVNLLAELALSLFETALALGLVECRLQRDDIHGVVHSGTIVRKNATRAAMKIRASR